MSDGRGGLMVLAYALACVGICTYGCTNALVGFVGVALILAAPYVAFRAGRRG